MITYIIIKMHCKRLLQIQDLQGVLQRAYGAPTKRPERPHSVATTYLQRDI